MAEPRTYGGVSADERRARRRAALIEAGLDLLGTGGWTSTTVRGVCARANLIPRYFYESFADREELLLAVFDELAAGGAAAIVDAVAAAPHDAEKRARAAIDAFVGYISDDPRRGRVLLLEANASEPLQRRRYETIHAFARLVREEAQAFYGDAAPPRTDAELTALALVGALAELLISWTAGDLRVSRERLVDHCAALFVAAGGVTSAPKRRG